MRTISPTKSELEKISKIMVKEMMSELRTTLGLSQWKISRSIIIWFRKIKDTHNCALTQLDIKDFRPSINEC